MILSLRVVESLVSVPRECEYLQFNEFLSVLVRTIGRLIGICLLIRRIEARWRFREWFRLVMDMVLGSRERCCIHVVFSHGFPATSASRFLYTVSAAGVTSVVLLRSLQERMTASTRPC
jgi:hypothetical protein